MLNFMIFSPNGIFLNKECIQNGGCMPALAKINPQDMSVQFFLIAPTNNNLLPSNNLKPNNCLKHAPKMPLLLKPPSNMNINLRTQKRKVKLSLNSQEFKNKFYQVFITKKRFDKNFVKKIHDILVKEFDFKPMTREEFRRIDLYFSHYSEYSNQILDYLQKNKEEIRDQIGLNK